MSQKIILFFSSILLLGCTHAVEYTITNKAGTTPGGLRFTNQIGLNYSRQTLNSATSFIWRIFQQNTDASRKKVPRVTLIIENLSGISYTVSGEIHVSANYIQDYSGDVKREITGVLYHEMTHIWQWDGNGQAPEGLIEGIADYVRLKAGYVPSHWVGPGKGDSWYEGYDVTARFLDYCNSQRNGFVTELNKKMRNGYNDNFFVVLTGKTVEQLWREYKAKYNS
ncbi:hypothetical protein LguiB_021963 [Lonicera macranthoides]